MHRNQHTETDASAPVPPNEFERAIELSDYGLDYAALQEELGGLTRLAASIAGVKISMVNLIDYYTQWTVARTGVDLLQMPREQSVCQHTIMGELPLEIAMMESDVRTQNQPYVVSGPGLRYYYGLPLRNKQGFNLGALCVADTETRVLSEVSIELLKILAAEVIARLESIRERHHLQASLRSKQAKIHKVSHDVRGPVSGMIGLADILASQLAAKGDKELSELASLIHDAGQSVLELTDGILQEISMSDAKIVPSEHCTLRELALAMDDLFLPQAICKGVHLTVSVEQEQREVPLARHQLLQVCGNLVSNAVKFTPEGGQVSVRLDFCVSESISTLRMRVSDTGAGMSDELRERILSRNAASSPGTRGERGYGMGLQLVQEFTHQLGGSFQLDSSEGAGCLVEVLLPLE